MGSKKQQEMVERSESASPFWRTRSSPNQHEFPPRESSKVMGAAYSHADMLKLDSLSLGRTPSPSTPGRPQTPRTEEPRTTASKTRPAQTSLQRRNYSNFLSEAGGGAHDSDEFDGLDYDEEEDEFGLPSIASAMRRRRTERPKNGSARSHLEQSGQSSYFPHMPDPSGDISEERNLPTYPSAKKSQGKILRPQYKDILRDPANFLHLIDHSPLPHGATVKESQDHSAYITRINKFKTILQKSSISLSELRDSAWSGIPQEVRAMSWQVLLGYLPTSSERRVATLERKRKEYLDGVRQAFGQPAGAADHAPSPRGYRGKGQGIDEAIWHQISIDVPRTNPHLQLYSYVATQRSLERILYVWAIRHPASGYVQGINDLVTPFWQVFLASYITDADVESGMDPGQLPRSVLDAVEADSFWCLSKLLDGIQDNYVHAQPGIQRQVSSLRDLTKRIDLTLFTHLEAEGVEFMQFSFRWMNCLLMREVSVRNVIRMWDTYLSEEQGFSEFHLYVCAAFLIKWSDQLVKMEFQDIMMFLQALPTREWSSKDIELLLSEAFIWQSLYKNASAHLSDSKGSSTTGFGYK